MLWTGSKIRKNGLTNMSRLMRTIGLRYLQSGLFWKIGDHVVTKICLVVRGLTSEQEGEGLHIGE